MSDNKNLLAEITKGKELHHAETADKSVPITEGASVKKNEHGKLLTEIKDGAQLSHVDSGKVHDASAPNTAGAHVGHNKHADLLNEVKSKAK